MENDNELKAKSDKKSIASEIKKELFVFKCDRCMYANFAYSDENFSY